MNLDKLSVNTLFGWKPMQFRIYCVYETIGAVDWIPAPGPMGTYWNYRYFCMPAQMPTFSQK